MSVSKAIIDRAVEQGLIRRPFHKPKRKFTPPSGVTSRHLIECHATKIAAMLNEGKTLNDIATAVNVSKPTLCQATKQIGEWVFVPYDT